MNLRDILQSKGHVVYTVSPRASLADAVQVMVEHNCGSLVVCDGDPMVGILSERDILRSLSERPLEAVAVEERMTRNVITAQPDDDLGKVMGIMTQHRIRHLPVTDHGRVVGLVSIGDVVKAQFEQLAVENHFLKSYIQS